MEYIIGGIVILLCLFLAGHFLKKKYYKETDKLEAWKIDIMNRPILEEMSKVKQLNMTGQTEELFERWRNEWDDIVTVKLPDIEEQLFDAEEVIDNYRFNKAKAIHLSIEANLREIEKKLETLLAELNNLVGSEEKNRTEIEELKEMYRDSKKILLAHRHSFGRAEARLEQQLLELGTLQQEFYEKTENGNYLEAREIILVIHDTLNKIKHHMDIIPDLLVECLSKIPSQLSELKDGYKEMLEQGYILEHIQLEKEIKNIEKNLELYLEYIEKTEINDVLQGVDEIRESLEVLYDLLEKEVHAKHYLETNIDDSYTILTSVKEANERLKKEIQHIQQSYHLHESKLEDHYNLDKNLNNLFKRFELLEHKLDNGIAAHTVLSEELKNIKRELDEISNEQSLFFERLYTLRKDELAAREKVKELSKKISETLRLVSKSNLPGLSEEYRYLMEDARESIQSVRLKLEEKPLDIPAVKQYLEDAEFAVEKMTISTKELIETVHMAERVIQYGNRYRSRYPSIEKGLKEAEALFRSYDYKSALEQAATSIEEIDKDALKKIDYMVK